MMPTPRPPVNTAAAKPQKPWENKKTARPRNCKKNPAAIVCRSPRLSAIQPAGQAISIVAHAVRDEDPGEHAATQYQGRHGAEPGPQRLERERLCFDLARKAHGGCHPYAQGRGAEVKHAGRGQHDLETVAAREEAAQRRANHANDEIDAVDDAEHLPSPVRA